MLQQLQHAALHVDVNVVFVAGFIAGDGDLPLPRQFGEFPVVEDRTDQNQLFDAR